MNHVVAIFEPLHQVEIADGDKDISPASQLHQVVGPFPSTEKAQEWIDDWEGRWQAMEIFDKPLAHGTFIYLITDIMSEEELNVSV